MPDLISFEPTKITLISRDSYEGRGNHYIEFVTVVHGISRMTLSDHKKYYEMLRNTILYDVRLFHVGNTNGRTYDTTDTGIIIYGEIIKGGSKNLLHLQGIRDTEGILW